MNCKNILTPLALFLSTCLLSFLYFNTVSTKIELHINSFSPLGRKKPLLFPQQDEVEGGPSKTSITKIWMDTKEAIKGNLHRYLAKMRLRGRPSHRHGAGENNFVKYGPSQGENSLRNYKHKNKMDKE